MRLIEPLGLLQGPDAAAAVRAGLALPLAGGPLAFTLARLIEAGPPAGSAPAVVRPLLPVASIPAGWDAAVARITAPVPAWAGLSRPAAMGILNVTPDSFSDGGAHPGPEAAVAAGAALAADGAAIVDVGGESTRPDAAPTPPAAEQARVLPVIAELARRGIAVSVDSRHAETMARALEAGAIAVNDVSGLAHDPEAARVVARAGIPVVLMHMRGDPATMRRHAVYGDVAVEVTAELAARVRHARDAGIAADRIAVDPGIGFAKTGEHSLELLARLPLLCNLGCPIVVGVSRKSFIGRLTGVACPRDRDPGSLALGLRAVNRGASILRTHEVRATVQALRVHKAGLT